LQISLPQDDVDLIGVSSLGDQWQCGSLIFEVQKDAHTTKEKPGMARFTNKSSTFYRVVFL